MTIVPETQADSEGETRSSIKAFVIDGHDFRIRPAPVEREWMDATDGRFAYRCLPLNIANAHGWELLTPVAFSATWNGQKSQDAIRIGTMQRGAIPPAISHFGHGVLTFHVPCLFKTEPGVSLFVSGPINRPKDAIAALSGVIETDWSPYPFTMNWKFTRAFQRIHFDVDEPFCHLFPVGRTQLNKVDPEIANLSDNVVLQQEYSQWSASRHAFNADLSKAGTTAANEKWQKTYFRGLNPSGAPGPEDHASRLRLKPFERKGSSLTGEICDEGNASSER